MTRTLFLSHNPHESHLNFAKSVNSRVKVTPFDGLVKISKKWSAISYIYPVICLTFGFFLKIDEETILVDGGSSIWIATAIKIKHPDKKIIYLDGDLFIYKMLTDNFLIKKLKLFALRKIDKIISVSDMSRQLARKILDIQIEVCPPHPNETIKIEDIKKENYGLIIGRLDPDKKIVRTIKFGIQCPYLDKIIIVGDGLFGQRVKKIAKDNKKITFVGGVKDVSKYYNRCKFLLHLPDFDPFACTSVEAALCGCYPIISENVGASYLFDEIFKIKDPTNFKDINRKIKYILEDENLAKSLLKISIKNIPTKQSSSTNFKEKFNQLVKS